MNIKNILLSATIAAGSIFGAIAPAEAGTCWFSNGQGSLAPSYCQTGRRVNANGHVVFDVIDYKGTEMTLVLWDDNTAEMIVDGQKIWARTWYDRSGDLRLETAHGEMAIRF